MRRTISKRLATRQDPLIARRFRVPSRLVDERLLLIGIGKHSRHRTLSLPAPFISREVTLKDVKADAHTESFL